MMIAALVWIGGVAVALTALIFATVSGDRDMKNDFKFTFALPPLLWALGFLAIALLLAFAAGLLAAQAASLGDCNEACIVTLAEGNP